MGGTSAAGQVVTWSITIVVARLLRPEDYGLVAISGLFPVFAMAVSEMGIGAAVIQRPSVTPGQIGTLYGISLLVGAAMTLAGFAVAPVMAWVFADPRLRNLVAFQSLVFLLGAAKSMQRNLLVRESRFNTVAKIDLLSRLATSFCTLSLVLAGFSYWALAAQWLLIEFFQFVLYWRIVRASPRLTYDLGEVRGVLAFGGQILSRNVVGQAFSLADTAILGRLASKDFVGAYGFARQLTNVPFEKVLAVANQVFLPYLARRQGNLAQVRDFTLRVIDLQALMIAPFFSLLFFSAAEVVEVLLGPKWSSAVFPLRVFCAAGLFRLAENFASVCLTAIGQVSLQVRYVLAQFVVVCGGMVAVGLSVGPEWSILLWVTGYPLLVLLYVRALLRALSIEVTDLLRRLGVAITAHAVLLATLTTADAVLVGPPWSVAGLKSLAGCAAYVAVVLAMDRGKAADLLRLLAPARRSG
jgi:O-antigen/teichoic acid export membrane protein